MLDMGFYEDIMKISKVLPKKRQNLLFSNYASKIRQLTKQYTQKSKEYQYINIQTNEGLTQHAYMTHDNQKVKLVKAILEKKVMI